MLDLPFSSAGIGGVDLDPYSHLVGSEIFGELHQDPDK
jgi:hypothetical protein